jgi:SIR2-like domain
MAASRDPSNGKLHPEASWAGLLQNGLEWLKHHKHMGEDETDAHLILLKKRGDTHHYVSAAEDIVRLMGGVESQHFREWLTRTVGSITAHDRSVLDALNALREHGNLLATTNYDGLLLDGAGRLTPVTWQDPDAFLGASRNREIDKIIFLHGFWRQPKSVILDWKSYFEITRDERYRQDLATIWQMTTWLYVGCGVNGLNDPDFGLLLARYGSRARRAELWDFCLVRSAEREEFQAHFDDLKLNIYAVAFGDSHEELPVYLRSLLPTSGSVTVSAAAPDTLSVEPITAFLRVTDGFFQYRAPGTAAGGSGSESRGDFRFTADEFRLGAVHRAQAVDLALRKLQHDGIAWLEGPSAGGKTTVCLHLVSEWDYQGHEPLYLDLSDEPDAGQAAWEIKVHAEPGRMFILDNVHDARKVACALIDQWRVDPRGSVIVLLGWPSADRPSHDYLRGYRYAVVPVAIQSEDWIGVYQSTYRLVRGPSQIPPVPPVHVVEEWDGTFGADLVTFQYALSAGLRLGRGNAFHVEQAAADRYVRDTYLGPCLEDERHDLFVLAWLAELNISVPHESVRSGFSRSLASGLIRTTFHGRLKNYLRYQPWHRSLGCLLRGIASDGSRKELLFGAATSYPYLVYRLAQQLQKRGEKNLAAEILTHTLAEVASLVDWFGDTLTGSATIMQVIQNLIPSGWPAAAAQLAEPSELERICAKAFATPLGDLVTFLRFIAQTNELKPVKAAIVNALNADAALPAEQSRLLGQVFATPLHFLTMFLQFTMQKTRELETERMVRRSLQLPARTNELNPVKAAVLNALNADAALPTEQSRLLGQVFATPLHLLVTFLRFIAHTNELRPVKAAVVYALNADAALPAEQSRLLGQVFATPLDYLVTFLRFIAQTNEFNELRPVKAAVVNALNADAALPAEQSRLIRVARATRHNNLRGFLNGAMSIPDFVDLVQAIESDRICAAVLEIPLKP